MYGQYLVSRCNACRICGRAGNNIGNEELRVLIRLQLIDDRGHARPESCGEKEICHDRVHRDACHKNDGLLPSRRAHEAAFAALVGILLLAIHADEAAEWYPIECVFSRSYLTEKNGSWRKSDAEFVDLYAE